MPGASCGCCTWMAEARALEEPFSAALPEALAGSCIGNGAAGSRTDGSGGPVSRAGDVRVRHNAGLKTVLLWHFHLIIYEVKCNQNKSN